MFDLQKETYTLEAEEVITFFDSQKYVNWAIRALENGYESDNLFILAGFDHEEKEVVHYYFEKALLDFGLDTNHNNPIKFDVYAKYIMESVINQSIDATDGLYLLEKIYETLNFDQKYLTFISLSNDFYYLKYGNYTLYNTIESLDDAEKYIIEECKLFLKYESIQDKKDIEKLVYCDDCKSINLPSTRKSTIFSQVPNRACCSKCRSKNIYPFADQVGRKNIIENILNTANKMN